MRLGYDTGVKLVTDKKVDGLDSIDTTEGLSLCWGEKKVDGLDSIDTTEGLSLCWGEK